MKLQELARTIRSKNAGPYWITVEIIFDNAEVYQQIKTNEWISRKIVADAYRMAEEAVHGFVFYDPGLGIKANFKRDLASGGPFETDVYGCQQYIPLLDIEIPIKKTSR